MRAFVLLALAACSFPEKRFVGGGDGDGGTDGPKDGQNGDMMVTGDMMVDGTVNPNFPCSGMPLPTTAPGNVTISGHAQDTFSTNAPGNASVQFLDPNETAYGNASTNANGDYTRSLATGGTPLPVHVRIAPTNYLPARAWPSRPAAADLVLNIQLVDTQTTLSSLATIANVNYDPTRDVVWVVPRDCSGGVVTGAVASSTPAGDVRYIDSAGMISSTLTATTSFGAALIFNVAPGSVVVGTRAQDGTQFRNVTIAAVGNSGWSIVYIQP